MPTKSKTPIDLVWERVDPALNRLHPIAFKLRLGIVADSIEAFRVGWRRSFERRIQQTAEVRMLESARAVLGENDPKRNELVIGLLLAAISLDPKVTAEMSELQRLPVSRFAIQARILALDDAVDRHWCGAIVSADRADMLAVGAMECMCEAGVTFAADALPVTQRSLLRRLIKDTRLCAAMANSASQDSVPLDAIDEAVERHLPRVIWGGLRKNGQPIPEVERATVGPQIFGGVKSNG